MATDEEAVMCSIVFVPDDPHANYRVQVSRTGADGGHTETQQFRERDAAFSWANESFKRELDAWHLDQEQFEELKKTASPEKHIVYFITDLSQIPEAERMRKRREAALAAQAQNANTSTK